LLRGDEARRLVLRHVVGRVRHLQRGEDVLAEIVLERRERAVLIAACVGSLLKGVQICLNTLEATGVIYPLTEDRRGFLVAVEERWE